MKSTTQCSAAYLNESDKSVCATAWDAPDVASQVQAAQEPNVAPEESTTKKAVNLNSPSSRNYQRLLRFAGRCLNRDIPAAAIYVAAKRIYAKRICPARIRLVLQATGIFVL